MKRNSVMSIFPACLLMLLLILDGKTALEGAKEGMDLVLTTLIPSFFPFLFLSIWITGSDSGSDSAILSWLGKVYHMPRGSEILLIPGILGGYPAGAQAVGQAYTAGRFSRETAQKLLAFCSNAGPSFLFGITAAYFPAWWMVWALWFFQLFGAWVSAGLFQCTPDSNAGISQYTVLSPVDALKKAISAMAVIGSWVMLFRILITFLDRWLLWALPPAVKTLIIGFLELTNGICSLGMIEDIPMRFCFCSIMLSLGGLCVYMQTVSVTAGLSLKKYCFGKLIQALVSVSCSAAVFYSRFFLVIPLCLCIPGFLQKRSRNPAMIGV